MTRIIHRIDLVAAAAIAAIAFASPAGANPTDTPSPPPTTKSGEGKSGGKASGQKPAKPDKGKPDKKSESDFLDRYKQAYELIYRKQDYAAGIAALRALGHDEHPDVANLIGFSSRKLGRVEDARLWYEKALAADPKHTRTWQYYGMWHLEQGNRLKAEDHLEQIRLICGESCDDYRLLRAALEGNATY